MAPEACLPCDFPSGQARTILQRARPAVYRSIRRIGPALEPVIPASMAGLKPGKVVGTLSLFRNHKAEEILKADSTVLGAELLEGLKHRLPYALFPTVLDGTGGAAAGQRRPDGSLGIRMLDDNRYLAARHHPESRPLKGRVQQAGSGQGERTRRVRRLWRCQRGDGRHDSGLLALLTGRPDGDTHLSTRPQHPAGLLEGRDRMAGELKGVEVGDGVEGAVRPGKVFHIADTEIAIWNALPGDVDRAGRRIQTCDPSAAAGSERGSAAGATAHIQQTRPAPNAQPFVDRLVQGVVVRLDVPRPVLCPATPESAVRLSGCHASLRLAHGACTSEALLRAAHTGS